MKCDFYNNQTTLSKGTEDKVENVQASSAVREG